MKITIALGVLVSLSAGLAGAQNIALLGIDSATRVTAEVAAVEPVKKGQIGACTGDPGGADFWAKAAGKAGIPVIGDALLIMKARNHDRTAKALGAREREALRPIFGGIVDQVKVVWSARLLDKWRILGKTFQLGMDTAGQTFGNTVYIAYAEPEGDWSRDRLHLVIHEMTHTYQAHDRGSLRAFAEHYVRGWWQAGRSYADNWMEVQARCVADAEIGAAYQRYVASAPRASR